MKKILAEHDIKKIHELYPFSHNLVEHIAFGHYYKIYEECQIIKEYIRTVPIEQTINNLPDAIKSGMTIKKDATGKNILIIFDNLNQDLLDKINKQLNSFGWYPTTVGINKFGGGTYKQKIKDFINKQNVPILYLPTTTEKVDKLHPYLYHLIPDISYKKVKMVGLITKTQSKIGNHPDRIYLFNGLPTNISDISDYLLLHHREKNRINEMYLLQIPTNKLYGWDFYKEDEFKLAAAIWTYQMIPPGYITVIKKFPNEMKDPENTIQI